MAQKIHILIGSTRESRLGASIAQWVQKQIIESFDTEVEVIDLHKEQLPFFNNANAPMRTPDDTEHGKAWAKKIQQVERLVIVTPEYNRGVPAALKNALDYLWTEWNNLPVAVVSYGYVDGGANAASHLKDTLSWLQASQTKNSLQLKLTVDMLSETGTLKNVDEALKPNVSSLKEVIEELIEIPARK